MRKVLFQVLWHLLPHELIDVDIVVPFQLFIYLVPTLVYLNLVLT